MPKLRHGEVKLTARQIVDLLAVKHASDVFVPECKDGPTQRSTHFRLDAWAMYRSWSNPLTVGYEVKVTRADFLRDDKWQAYLTYCSEFYFVCPHGVIYPEDLPPEAGLLHTSATGTRLFMKKKAQRRAVEIPENFFRYILMYRASIDTHRYGAPVDKREVWRAWLAQNVADRELGYNVSRGIRESVEAQVDKIKQENRDLKRQMQGYDQLRSMLGSLGLDPDHDYSHWTVKNRLAELRRVVPSDLDQRLTRLLDAAQDFRKELDAMKGEPVDA